MLALFLRCHIRRWMMMRVLLQGFHQFSLWRRWMRIVTLALAVCFTLAHRWWLLLMPVLRAILLWYAALHGTRRRCARIVRTGLERVRMLLTTLRIGMIPWWLSLFGMWQGMRVPEVALRHNKITLNRRPNLNTYTALWFLNFWLRKIEYVHNVLRKTNINKCYLLCADRGCSIRWLNAWLTTSLKAVYIWWFSPEIPVSIHSSFIHTSQNWFRKSICTYPVAARWRLASLICKMRIIRRLVILILNWCRFLGRRIDGSTQSTLLQLRFLQVQCIIVVFDDGLLNGLYTGLQTRWGHCYLLRFVCCQVLSTANGNNFRQTSAQIACIGFVYFLLSVIVVIVFSGSCVEVKLPTDVISVISVVLANSLRTIGTDSRERFNNGSDSQLLPSNQLLASGPSLRINA